MIRNEHTDWVRRATAALALATLVAATATAAAASTGWEFVNPLGMHFVPVKRTKVLFSVWETRISDYRAWVDDGGRERVAPAFAQGDDHPVVNISWDDASGFCAWLNTRDPLPSGARYRLPSSAEWDRAAGLPAPRRDEFTGDSIFDPRYMRMFPWGESWPPPADAGNYHPSLGVDDFDHTSPVGSFAANRNGIHDLGGNVWEWTGDWFNDSPDFRVLRGASWRMRNPGDLLAATKVGNVTHLRLDTYGFRCVIEAGRKARRALRK